MGCWNLLYLLELLDSRVYAVLQWLQPQAVVLSCCPKFFIPPKKAFLWVNIHILKRRKGGGLCPMPDISGFWLVMCKLASWETVP